MNAAFTRDSFSGEFTMRICLSSIVGSCVLFGLAPFADAASSPASGPFGRIASQIRQGTLAALSRNRTANFSETVADSLLLRGEYAQALEWYTRWQPESGCGTCSLLMESKRMARISRLILLKRANDDEAKLWLELMVFPESTHSSPHAEMVLAELYRRRHDLDSLERLFSESEESRKLHRAGIACIALARAADREDIGQLWNAVVGSKYAPGARPVIIETIYAARLLAAIPAAKERILEEAAKPGLASLWAECILARMQAPEAFELLSRRIKLESSDERRKAHLYALAILGTPQAYQQLRIFARAESWTWHEAREVLHFWPEPGIARDIAD